MIEMEPLVLLEPGTIGRNLGFSNALRTVTPERFFCRHDSYFFVKTFFFQINTDLVKLVFNMKSSVVLICNVVKVIYALMRIGLKASRII